MQEVESNHKTYKDKIIFTYHQKENNFFIEMYNQNGEKYLNCFVDGDDLINAIWQEIK